MAGLGVAALFGAGEAKAKKRRKKKIKKEDCRLWILSGGPDATDEIFVDDDLQVHLNGEILFQDGVSGANDIRPIVFQARPGYQMQIAAVDTAGPCHGLSSLYLHCACGGSRKLSDALP